MAEFAFDVKLFAVVRVEAESEDAARQAMRDVLDAVEPSSDFLDGYNSDALIRVTEFSLSDEDGTLFEVDGESVE